MQQLRAAVSAVSVDDAATSARIRHDYRRYGRVWCPHTAVAAEVYANLDAAQRAHSPWLLVATAHPAKFREIVEPLIGTQVPVPESLERLFARPASFTEIEPTLPALAAALDASMPRLQQIDFQGSGRCRRRRGFGAAGWCACGAGTIAARRAPRC